MRMLGFLAAVALLAPVFGRGAERTDQDIEAYLATMRVPGKMFANIEPEEGRYLRDLVVKTNAKRVLEIGTSTGYSGIWMAMGLRQTGGRLITLEIDRGRYESARANVHAAGLDNVVDLRFGDALRQIPGIDGPFDMVFIDAWKPDYLKYYDMVLPKMRRGGIITAHNVKSHPHEMSDFLERIHSDPKVKTEIVVLGQQKQGISVSRVQ